MLNHELIQKTCIEVKKELNQLIDQLGHKKYYHRIDSDSDSDSEYIDIWSIGLLNRNSMLRRKIQMDSDSDSDIFVGT